MEKLSIQYDESFDLVRIEGVNYAASMFRELGGLLPLDVSFKIVKRENGTLAIYREDDSKISDPETLPLPRGVDEIYQAAQEEYERFAGQTPALRQWAMEMAIKAGATNNGFQNVQDVAQGYVEYVLRGEK